MRATFTRCSNAESIWRRRRSKRGSSAPPIRPGRSNGRSPQPMTRWHRPPRRLAYDCDKTATGRTPGPSTLQEAVMPLVCLGLSHHTAPVEVRERHAFPAARMGAALVALRDYEAVREAVMLQTCGRLEIYADVSDYEAGAAQLKSFLLNFRHGTVAYDLESYLYTLLGRGAVEHLFRVSTGLDSMLIGEAEILGQVKDAYIAATRVKSLGRTLHHLFREALAADTRLRA